MQLGIVVNSLNISQHTSLLIQQLNAIKNTDEYIDIALFYDDYDISIFNPHFGIFPQKHMWSFSGPVLATNLKTAQKLINCPAPTKKFFYVWDLEWIHMPTNFVETLDIYCNDKIELIARNEQYFSILEQQWKKPIGIVEDFNYEQLITII